MVSAAVDALERGFSLGLRVSWRIVRAIAAVAIVGAIVLAGKEPRA